MNLQLDGKKTLVTGSTAGIGFAIARMLAREGASVVITGRTQQRVENATESIQKEIRDAKISGIAADQISPGGGGRGRRRLRKPPVEPALPGRDGDIRRGRGFEPPAVHHTFSTRQIRVRPTFCPSTARSFRARRSSAPRSGACTARASAPRAKRSSIG